MKKFASLNYDNFFILGEVDERLPLNLIDNIENVYPLDNTSDGYYSDFEIRVVNGAISEINGTDSFILNKSNLSIEDEAIKFSGVNSFIELNKEILNIENFEIEMKFKMKNLASDTGTLFSCKRENSNSNENELSLNIDNRCRYIYVDMDNLDKVNSTKPDINEEGSYSLTGSGSIIKDTWHTLKICKYNSILVFYLDEMLTRSLVCKGNIQVDRIFIGQDKIGISNNSFNGLIEYIKINHINTSFLSNRHLIKSNSIKENFSLFFEWNVHLLDAYEIINLGDLSIKSNFSKLELLKNDVKISECILIEDHKYYIGLTYNRTEQLLKMIVLDMTTNEQLITDSHNLTINASNIDVILNDTVRNLVVMKKDVEEKFIQNVLKRRFSLKHDGNIKYEIEENLDYMLPKNFENNIIYKKIGDYNAEAILDLTHMHTKDAEINNENRWDNNLNKNTYLIKGWSSGFNASVKNSEIGYHAKWVMEGYNSRDIALKFTNANNEFDMPNRWLGSGRGITPAEFFNNCKAGDNLKVIFRARANKKSDIVVGFYRRQLDDNNLGFANNRKKISIEGPGWNDYIYETTIDDNWNLNEYSSLYFYGNYTEDAIIWIQDIFVLKNGKNITPTLLLDKNHKYYEKQVSLNDSWQLIYNKEIVSLNEDKQMDSIKNELSWGIENNKVVFKYKNEISNIIDGLHPKDIIGETLHISLKQENGKVELFIFTKKGLFKSEINKKIVGNKTLSLGKIDNITYGCAFYRELKVINNEVLSNELLEKYFRTKISYYKNNVYSSVSINEIKEE